MLRDYELIYILKPDLTNDQLATEQEYVRNAIAKFNGEIKKEDDWGVKPLPFEIKSYREGHFCLVRLSMPPDNPAKLKYELKINDRIIRNMLTISQ